MKKINQLDEAMAAQATAFHAAMLKVLDRIAPPLVAALRARGQQTAASLIASIGDALLTYGPLDRDVYTKHAEFLVVFNAKQVKFKRKACDTIARHWIELEAVAEFEDYADRMAGDYFGGGFSGKATKAGLRELTADYILGDENRGAFYNLLDRDSQRRIIRKAKISSP